LGLEAVTDIRGARILLVEDNEVNQQIATELLELAQMIVTVAENGHIAVNKVKVHPFDAVLMDIQMPVMDGYTASREIRKNSALNTLPIIAMTANAMAGDKDKCLDAGMNDHVAKPIDPQEMYRALAQWIKPGKRTVPDKAQYRLLKPDSPIKDIHLSLPGFDVENAMIRMGNDVEAYRKILAKVMASETDAIKRIEACLIKGDQETAILIAHTLKGVSGSIGATSLQAAAKELEAALLSRQEQGLNTLISQTNELLKEALAIIKVALIVPESKTPHIQANVMSKKECIAELEKISERVNNYDSTAQEAVEKLLKNIDDIQIIPLLKCALSHLEKYDFDAASPLIDEIKTIAHQG
jgi:polar amino acid transport system substrate-binding protein